MAGMVDILLRIVADVRDAVTGIDQVGDAANRADRQVDELNDTTATAGSRFDRAVNGAFTFAGAMSGVVTAVVAGWEGLDRFGRGLDQVLGAQERVAKQSRQFAEAVSGPDLEKQFGDVVQARARSFSDRGGIIGTVSAALGQAGRNFLPGGGTPGQNLTEEREAVQFFGDIARSDPNRARALLAGDLGDLEYLRRRFERILDQLGRAQAFTQSIATTPTVPVYQQGYQRTWDDRTVVNINMGVGDGQRAGEEARAILDRRDRNNGYTTTYNRPGR